MTDQWNFVLLFAMWAVMMAGMMLPPAVPTLVRYAGVTRRSPAIFTGGYLLVWTGFSLIATLLQLLFANLLWLNPMMEAGSRAFGATLLMIAGVYQLTPWKRTYLHSWRSSAPLGSGGFRVGLLHGFYSLGCCWALMLLLFVGGVMNPWCIAALTLFVLLEKLVPLGTLGSRLSGVLIIALGAWYLAAS